MVITNEDVKALVARIPDGHKHVRFTLHLEDGKTMTFQEATIANLVRAYITIKTHPRITMIRFRGTRLEERKEDFAEWQLVEEDEI